MSTNSLYCCLFTLFVTVTFGASIATTDDFGSCKQKYDSNIGKLVASEGVATVTNVLKLFYNELDLNGNNQLSGSEVIIKLESENIISSANMASVLPQMQSWVNLGSRDGDSELTLDEFVKLVDLTIGQTDALPGVGMKKAEYAVCQYINSKMAELISTYDGLSSCVSALKAEQLSLLVTGSKRVVVNTWNAAFKTIDSNHDGFVEKWEIQTAYEYYNQSTDNNSQPFEAIMANQSKMSKKQFFTKVHDLLFGTANWEMWNDVSTMTQLYANEAMCFVLRSARNDVTSWMERNANCSKSYKETLTRVLGKDAFVSPQFVFAFADTDKDGVVSPAEMRSLANEAAPGRSFNTGNLISVQDAETPLTAENITRFLPDRVVEVMPQSKGDKYELSALSRPQQENWNTFCYTVIRIVESFPRALKPTATRSSSNKTAEKSQQLPGTASTNNASSTTLAMTANSTSAAIQTSPPTTSAMITTKSFFVRANQSSTETATTTMTNPKNDTDLYDAVRDVIKDLRSDNATESDRSVVQELKKFKSEFKKAETQGEEKQELSEEEQQLFNLITDFKNEMHRNKKKRPAALAETKPSVTSEERELKELLQSVLREN